MNIPDKAQSALGTGGIIAGYDVQGKPIVVPDDLGTGKRVFEANYNSAKGDLGKVEQNGAAIVAAFNVFNDPHASPEERVAAIAVIYSIALNATVEALILAGVITTASVATAIPVVNLVVLAYLAVLLVVLEVVGNASAGTPRQDTPEEVLASQIRLIPTDIPLPPGMTPPTLGAVRAMGLLSDILDIESKTPSDWLPQEKTGNASPYRLALAQIFNNQGGFAEDIYRIVADVVQNPRWRGGKVVSFNLTETQRTGGRGFEIGSTYAKALESFRNTDTPTVSTRLVPVSVVTANPAMALSTQTAVELSKRPTVQVIKNGAWKIPRFLPSENPYFDPPGVRPFDVGRYLVIFAVMYSLSMPKQARAATYAAVYIILLQKAWAYKAANVPVPDDLSASMGFLLDLVSQYPLERVDTRLAPVTRAPIGISQPLFKDVDFYVRYYLKLGSKATQQVPGTLPEGPKGGGAQQPGGGSGVFNPNRPGGGIAVRGLG